jgi:hypothetical protein
LEFKEIKWRSFAMQFIDQSFLGKRTNVAIGEAGAQAMFEIVLTERTSTSRRLVRGGGLVLLVVAVVLSTMVIAVIQTHLPLCSGC